MCDRSVIRVFDAVRHVLSITSAVFTVDRAGVALAVGYVCVAEKSGEKHV